MATTSVSDGAITESQTENGAGSPLLSVDEALAHIISSVQVMPTDVVTLESALGLTIAEDVPSKVDLPPFSNSAMDGYAVRSSDTASANYQLPVELAVCGSVAAGSTYPRTVGRGQAVRIMTGAPMPDGTDAVIKVEDTQSRQDAAHNEVVIIQRKVVPGDCVRFAGEDVRQEDVVLTAGTAIRGSEVGLLAATGHACVSAVRRPTVGILVTGDEIIPAGQPLGPGQIWNSNGPMIAAQVRQSGGIPVLLDSVEDSLESIRAGLRESQNCDFLITTGGVSVGDFDFVKNVLQQEGRIDLWKLRMKPGKPLAFGWIGETPVIGLPGNPVAAGVGFWQFAYPAIQKMLGRDSCSLPVVRARINERVENRLGRRQFVRVHVAYDGNGYEARVSGAQGSHILTSLVMGNGLLVIPEECDGTVAGELYDVQMIP